MAREQEPLTRARSGRAGETAPRALRRGRGRGRGVAFAAASSTLPTLAALVATLATSAPASAADQRPNEDDIFGAPAPSATGGAGVPSGVGGAAGASAPPSAVVSAPPPADVASPVAPGGAASQGASRDDSLLGDPNASPRLSTEVAPDDPLKIGGQVYLRAFSQATQGQDAKDIHFSAPTLVDAYFDARPNDRVRGFVLGRLFFDPTLPTTPATTSLTSMGSAAASTTLAVPLLSGVQSARGPSTVLDQLWLRFDILHAVFITAGRQHVKWGTARFWTPTDFLHPQPRNPIAAFDARPGFTMLKAHVPWEARGWNFYGFGLVEGVQQVDNNGRPIASSDGAGTVGQLGAAARAEAVFGPAELGLDTVLYRGHRPKLGGDLSFGIGDLDLYVDAALHTGGELAHRGYDPNYTPPLFDPAAPPTQFQIDQEVDAQYPVSHPGGVKPQITAGGTYSLKYNDNDVFTITGEYFYNSLGYDDPHVYPGLFLSNSFQFFYTGRHYAALGAIAAAPYSWNYTTFTLTTLGNLSDQSFITRLDYSLVLLTHLTFEAFGSIDYGHRQGEFRLGVDAITAQTVNGPVTFSLPPQLFSLGVGLRVKI